jgi:hypothetical protein
LENRHALGLASQSVAVSSGGIQLPAERVRLPLEPSNVSRACFHRLLQGLVELRERILRDLRRDPVVLSLLAQGPVAIGDDSLEPGAFGSVLSRNLLERLKRGLQSIERLTKLIVFSGHALKLRLARQPGAFVRLSVLLDSAV